jgi:hypothetical protein
MLYYMLPGTTSEEIDNELINDPNVKEGNECFYKYPQELYTRVLINKQDLKFEKHDNMSEDTYKYEWLRTYTVILNQFLVDLGNVCLCPKMTSGPDWEFFCVLYGGKNGFECCPVDYCIHNLEMFQTLLTNPSFYPNSSDITGKGPLAFPKILKNMHRMIAHIYHNYKDLFNKYEEKYGFNERNLLFCKKI